MIIYELTRQGETLALISKDFSLTHYYLKTWHITLNELALIEVVAEDLCVNDVDFEEYSKYWINDYRIICLKK